MGARLTDTLGAIIAGGSASRFGGVQKGLLDVGGLRIIDRLAAALHPYVSEIVIASNAAEAVDWLPEVQVIHDQLQGGGPAAGIHALLVARSQPVIAVAWDMPFVTGELVALVLGRASGSADVVVPESSAGQLEPLCAWYAPSFAATIASRWMSGDRSLHGLIRQARSVVIPSAEVSAIGDPARLFLNVNTADDLSLARRIA